MTTAEQRAVLALCLHAAFADGRNSEAEREAVRRVAEGLANPELNLAGLLQDVLLRRRSVEQSVADLGTPEARLLAYEMAVEVCDADGLASVQEKDFLERLRGLLGLSAAEAEPIQRRADEVAAAAAIPAVALPAAAAAGAAATPVPTYAPVDEAALDRSILNYSILNGALELLPETIATMAIIPLQMKMTYEIGKRYGYTLDRGHLRDLLATVGIGAASQVVEGFARKLLIRGLGRAIGLGGIGRTVASVGTGAAFSFASTYALGHLAKRYYAGGRQMNTQVLKDTYQSLIGRGRELFGQNQGAIENRARTIDLAQISQIVRGQA